MDIRVVGGNFLTRCGKTRPPGRRQLGMTTQHDLRAAHLVGPPVDVTEWRRSRLIDAGFPAVLAATLADTRVDVHALLQLVDRGCPPELAARILAPLDSPAPGRPS